MEEKHCKCSKKEMYKNPLDTSDLVIAGVLQDTRDHYIASVHRTPAI